MAEEAILTKHDGEVKMSKDFDYLCSKLRNGRYKYRSLFREKNNKPE